MMNEETTDRIDELTCALAIAIEPYNGLEAVFALCGCLGALKSLCKGVLPENFDKLVQSAIQTAHEITAAGTGAMHMGTERTQ